MENFEKVLLILPLELAHEFCYLSHFFFSFREGKLVVLTEGLSIRGQDALAFYVSRSTWFP